MNERDYFREQPPGQRPVGLAPLEFRGRFGPLALALFIASWPLTLWPPLSLPIFIVTLASVWVWLDHPMP